MERNARYVAISRPNPKQKGEPMTHGQLVSQSDTDRVTRAELRALPMPVATSTFKPVPHIEVVEKLIEALGFRQIGVVR